MSWMYWLTLVSICSLLEKSTIIKPLVIWQNIVTKIEKDAQLHAIIIEFLTNDVHVI